MFVPTQIPRPPSVVVPAPIDRLSARAFDNSSVSMVVTIRVRVVAASQDRDQDQAPCDGGPSPDDLIWG